QYRCYHISAGESSSVTWHEIAATFARYYGERPDNPYRQVDFQTIRNERDRLQLLLGLGDEEHLLMALQLYYRFGEIGVEMFANSRLLAEGMLPPPRFTSYLPLCVNTSAQRSVYQQMLDDE